MLYPIYEEIVSFYNIQSQGSHNPSYNNNSAIQNFIDSAYNRTVNALIVAARACVARMKPGRLKEWWNSSVTTLKAKSIASHTIWVDAG